MVGNALLRSGMQINFWHSKSERREGLHPVSLDHASIGLWIAAKITFDQQTSV